MRVLGHVGERVAQPPQQRQGARAIGVDLPREGDPTGGVATAADQVQPQLCLVDVPRLPHLAAVEANEVAPLAGELQEQDLVGAQLRRQVVRGRFEERPHAAPPKMAMSLNLQVGEAWPTLMTWLGSPLPQNGVPRTSKVDSSPTPDRARQKVAEMPR